MKNLDCKKHLAEMNKIHAAMGEKYGELFVTSKEELRKIKEEIKRELPNVSEEALECFLYQELSLGRLTPLLFEDNLEEIMVIGSDAPVYVYDRLKGMSATQIVLDELETREIIQKVAKFSGRRVDSSSPLLDGRLPDGSRVNATLPSVTPRGSTLTIRRFKKEPLTIADLIRYGTVSPKLAGFLWLAVEGLKTKPANILIIGGTASGKTTTLNALSYFIPAEERILSIEDTLEISLMHSHWVPMETRPPEMEGKNEITMDSLLKNALRMRPDRIIVGEVRAEEALTLFTAMNTGHDGCMATVHANSARESLSRLQSHPMNVPDIMIPALDLLIAQKRQVERGKLVRRVFEVAEISGREGSSILTNTLFKYEPARDKIEEKILNGRIIQELSSLSSLSVKEIDEEIEKRKALLETLSKSNLTHVDVHEIIQLYYKDPEHAVDRLSEKITAAPEPEMSVARKGMLGI